MRKAMAELYCQEGDFSTSFCLVMQCRCRRGKPACLPKDASPPDTVHPPASYANNKKQCRPAAFNFVLSRNSRDICPRNGLARSLHVTPARQSLFYPSQRRRENPIRNPSLFFARAKNELFVRIRECLARSQGAKRPSAKPARVRKANGRANPSFPLPLRPLRLREAKTLLIRVHPWFKFYFWISHGKREPTP